MKSFSKAGKILGAGYGILLSLFPSLTTEFYGLKNHVTNYEVLYTAWGVSGFIGRSSPPLPLI